MWPTAHRSAAEDAGPGGLLRTTICPCYFGVPQMHLDQVAQSDFSVGPELSPQQSTTQPTLMTVTSPWKGTMFLSPTASAQVFGCPA